jgi:hypothetical protein
MSDELKAIVDRAAKQCHGCYYVDQSGGDHGFDDDEARTIITRACKDYFDLEAPKHFAYLYKETEQLREELASLQEQLRECRKALAAKDYDLQQLLPKYHALLLEKH